MPTPADALDRWITAAGRVVGLGGLTLTTILWAAGIRAPHPVLLWILGTMFGGAEFASALLRYLKQSPPK